MPLLRGMARTAVIAGTATAVSNRVSRRQAGRWSRQAEDEQMHQQYEQQQYAPPPQQQQQYAAPAPAAPPPDPMNAKIEQLRQLGELKAQGVLSEAEFESQKARILNR
ncbi:hemolysin activation/secretion protein [Actinoplanes lutulentus]|uniref:Putative oligomerization/nucleic acid binding protein n=1 Tax=Actinoplanes lutulentus TaxID=1287878 RepID=A0A327ZB97_9ACTN|nr:SHOCT domain-containing protein [Actinoplanes lutulentus]MBB2941307.1 hemolysin activation/secretion protein [Actinoplanes lutulentus]RAK36799.1 putative oligomerization/nucleic acid binding protein [Actinoplanes lutulentus]